MFSNAIMLDDVAEFADEQTAKEIEEYINELSKRDNILNFSLYLKTLASGMRIDVFAYDTNINRKVRVRTFDL